MLATLYFSTQRVGLSNRLTARGGVEDAAARFHAGRYTRRLPNGRRGECVGSLYRTLDLCRRRGAGALDTPRVAWRKPRPVLTVIARTPTMRPSGHEAQCSRERTARRGAQLPNFGCRRIPSRRPRISRGCRTRSPQKVPEAIKFYTVLRLNPRAIGRPARAIPPEPDVRR